MKYIRFGTKDIPAVALGNWAWGTGFNGGKMVFGSTYSEEDLKPVFQKSMDLGCTLWDTAAAYGLGTAEILLGRFLKELDLQSLITVATKFSPLPLLPKNSLRHSVEKSLVRLGRNDVDLLWIHNALNVKRWTAEAAALYKDGRIKAVGVSNHNLDDVRQAADILANEGIKLAAVQNHYSLLYRGYEHSGLLDWCRENEVLFFAYMVLEQGALTGRYSAAHPFPAKSQRGRSFNPDKLRIMEPLIDIMRQTGINHAVEPAEIAIAWAMAKGTVPIIGVTKERHVERAAAATEIRLTSVEVKNLEDAAELTGINAKAFWEPTVKPRALT